MRKLLSLVLALTLALSFAGVAVAEEKPTITIWTTGSQNLSDLFTELCEVYNAQPDAQYTAKLQFILSARATRECPTASPRRTSPARPTPIST